jgi:hypothetical protein
LPPILISFNDQELAALRSAASALLPEQRDRFLKTVASALGCCVTIGPDTVAQVATAVATAVQHRLANGAGVQRTQRVPQIEPLKQERHCPPDDRERAGQLPP